MGELKEDENGNTIIKQELLTGKDILKSYKSGSSDGLLKYNGLLKALDLLPNWEENAKLDFFEQFWGLSDLLDAQCSSLISKFCQVEWHLLPMLIRPTFVELLRNIAIRHMNHTEIVFYSLTSHFLEKQKIEQSNGTVEFVSAISKEEQNEIFELAHSAIKTILSCCPMSINMLLDACRANYPNPCAPMGKDLSYMKNIIILTEYATTIRSKIWKIIIKNLIQIDALLSNKLDDNHMISHGIADDNGIFNLEEELMEVDQVVPTSKQDEELRIKLDQSLMAIFCYISCGYNKIDIQQNDDPLLNRIMKMNAYDFDMLNVFLPSFNDVILSIHGVQSVPFVWFYLCSLDDENMSKMFQYLWRLIITPANSPNEWKKSQNSASFLAEFLARAKFVKFSIAKNWMKKMASWASQYVDQTDSRKSNIAGGIQHGTFYSVVQALLFVVCFRYKEIIEKKYVDELQSWGFGKILHSQFEPLRNISSIIAECFAAVSRCIQLVYISHMLRTNERNYQLPIEPYFPFSFLQLPTCAKILEVNLRVFQPAEEDRTTITRELHFKKKMARFRHQSIKSDEFDFMYEDDLVLESRESTKASLLATSPFMALQC